MEYDRVELEDECLECAFPLKCEPKGLYRYYANKDIVKSANSEIQDYLTEVLYHGYSTEEIIVKILINSENTRHCYIEYSKIIYKEIRKYYKIQHIPLVIALEAIKYILYYGFGTPYSDDNLLKTVKEKNKKELERKVKITDKVVIDDKPQIKPQKNGIVSKDGYKRNTENSKNSIIIAKYCCEVDSSHKDFTSNITFRNYVEAHHLIPMEYQDEFNVSIDVEANIISLCVSCHRRLHHAIFEEKISYIQRLYNERVKRLGKCNIYITLEQLFNYYK